MDYVFLYAVCADRNGMIPPYDFVSDFVSNFVLIEFFIFVHFICIRGRELNFMASLLIIRYILR